MRNLFYALPLIIFAALGGLFYVGMQNGDDELPSTVVGQTVPLVQLEPMQGLVPFAGDDLAKGQVSFVNFWASWCAPCRAEHPKLMELSGQGVPVFGVNYKDNPVKAAAFLDELGNPYDMGGADPRAKMALDWGVYGLPETFVIGPDGTVILRVAGPLTERNMQTRVLPALSAKGLTLP